MEVGVDLVSVDQVNAVEVRLPLSVGVGEAV